MGCGIFRDVLHSGVQGSTEPYHLFAQVLPPRRLVRAEDGRGGGEGCSVIPDAEMPLQLHWGSPGYVLCPPRNGFKK